ncbi:G-protein coupled receptor Mth2-like [Adelges cooleyi]|uniref:G-protein coupled receptor Mth2-like n=1 Tax=Adelges cooleyi TaxID=133065 RepID=UPI0021809211|nr:G-protein coupled receptor Mth2-like [Adelges cooleyi]
MCGRTTFLLTIACLSAVVTADSGGGIRNMTAEWPCKMNKTVTVSRDNVTIVDNVLWTTGQPSKGYPPSAYRVVSAGYELCVCEVESCVRKCCKENKVFVENVGCSARNESLHRAFGVPKFVNGSGLVEEYEDNAFVVVYGKMKCSNKMYQLDPRKSSKDNFWISEKGWLINDAGKTISSPEQFCVDNFSNLNFDVLILVCFQATDTANVKEEWTTMKKFYTILMILSLPFLLATFLVYALVKELRNLHGKSLMCHIVALFVAYAGLCIVQIKTNEMDHDLCIVLAYIIQISFLASFFWLNVMCFDLWWTFSGYRPLKGNTHRQEAKKFVIYSIYAWGCTIIILIITLYMDLSPNETPNAIRPEFGKDRCWFYSKAAKYFYFYGPIGVLLLSNLLMFIYTTVKIVKHMKDAKVLIGSKSKKNIDHETQRFLLYLKLFIVMGISWLTEILAFEFKDYQYIWNYTDIVNSLQGVLIFCIFVCKKRVLKLMKKKCCLKSTQSTSVTSTRTFNSTLSKSSCTTKDSIKMNNINKQTSTSESVSDFKA